MDQSTRGIQDHQDMRQWPRSDGRGGSALEEGWRLPLLINTIHSALLSSSARTAMAADISDASKLYFQDSGTR